MVRKLLPKFTVIVAVLLLLLVLANFGVNYWMKNNLPNFIKNNSDYKVTYKTLDVELSTGNIISTGITVASKHPNDQNVIGLNGTVDSVSISRLGIWDALISQKINSSNLLMSNPNLKVTLAKPIDDRTGKKRNPMLFKNLKINNGNITVLRHSKEKFLAVNDLSLSVSNLRMTEKHVEDKLPVVFDEYSIRGNNFYFKPDNIYALTAKTITTKDGQMSIKNFELNPLISYAQFVRDYPKKANLFEFKTSEMDFKDIVLKDNKVTLSNVTFQNPDIKIFTTSAKQKSPEKSFKYEVNLEDILLNEAKVQILKPNGNKLFSANNLRMDIKKFLMNGETAQGNIPFSYEKFNISGKQINYITEKQDIKVAAAAFNPQSAEFRTISVKPLNMASGTAQTDVAVNHISVKFKEWDFKNNKLKLAVNDVLVNGLNGKIISGKKEIRKKPNYSGIEFPLTVKNISVRNSSLSYDNGERPFIFKDLNGNFNNIEMNAETARQKIPFRTGSYQLTTKNFNYKIDRFYTMSADVLELNQHAIKVNNFTVKPLVSRSQFIRMIPTERDLYDIKIAQAVANGDWDLSAEHKHINASSVVITGMDANIFRSKIPKDDPAIKPMYSELLRKIKFPLFVNTVDIKNSKLVYEEDTKKSDGPGKLTFGHFNMNVRHLNSGKMQGKPTLIPITIECRFMDVSPMKVKWNLNTANMSDAFTIAGNITDLPASSINAFVEPYLKVRTTGYIRDLIFSFKGNRKTLDGSVNMKHEKLKVHVLKQDGEKNKILSTLVNLVVRSNSGHYPASVVVDDVERDPTKSFFNHFWKGLEEGLKKTLIGDKAEKQEADAKKTVETTKETVSEIKSDFRNTKHILPTKREDAPAKDTEKKEKSGLKLKDLFRKKKKSEE